MKYNSILSALLLLVFSSIAEAQTAFWRIEPRYDQLEVMNENLLKVKSGDSFGVVKYDGTEITPCSYTQITTFREGRALLLNGASLRGVISENGKLIEFTQEYEVELSAPYYSEGLLAVKNINGQWGYLDKSGEEKIKCRYQNAYPFAYGLASVADDHFFMHIDTNGNVSYLGEGFNDDDLVFASTFTNSQEGPFAIVINSNYRMYKRTLDGRNLQGLGKMSDFDRDSRIIIGKDQYFFNSDWSLSYVTGSSSETFEDKPSPESLYIPSVPSVTAVADNDNKYDLRVGLNVVLQNQFERVIPLSRTLCAVSLRGKYGILDVFSEENLSVIPSVPSYSLFHHVPVEMTFQLDHNSMFGNAVLENVEIRTSDDDVLECVLKGDSFTFNYMPYMTKNLETKTFDITYSLSGLLYPLERVSVEFTCNHSFGIVWPSDVISLDSQHNAAFEVIVENRSKSASDECEVIVDGESYGKYTFRPNQRVPLQIHKLIDIQDEDQITKRISIAVREKGCPEYKASHLLVFERYFINN